MRDVTIVLPFYSNLGMLAEQQRVWMESYPDELRSHVHVVVVDDCSPDGQRPTSDTLVASGMGSLRLFRLLEKKRWNWLAARNLGAKEATTKWLLLTDVDHVVPVDTMQAIVTGKFSDRDVYRFRRVTAEHAWPYDVAALPAYKPHNDTWLLRKDLFFADQVAGYDERLSGCYGTSGEFRDRLVKAARAHVLRPEIIIRYPREVIPDASTPPTVYTRKNDPENDAELKLRKAQRDLIPGWRPLHGLVPWERVA